MFRLLSPAPRSFVAARRGHGRRALNGLANRLHLESAMQRVSRRALWTSLFSLTLLASGAVGVAYMYREEVASQSAPQLAEFAASVITDEAVDEAVRKQTEMLVNHLTTSPYIQAQVTLLLKKSVIDLTNDPSIQSQVAALIGTAITNQHNQELLFDLVVRALQDAQVQGAATALGLTSVHDVLDDEHIRAHASEMLRSLLADEALRRNTSEALWQVVKGTVTPGFMSGTSTAPTGESADKTAKPVKKRKRKERDEEKAPPAETSSVAERLHQQELHERALRRRQQELARKSPRDHKASGHSTQPE